MNEQYTHENKNRPSFHTYLLELELHGKIIKAKNKPKRKKKKSG